MAAKKIKEFKGFSGNTIHLMEKHGKLFVRKLGDVQRNIDRMEQLREDGFPVPELFYKGERRLDMEYLHGMDMRTYLLTHEVNPLMEFLEETFDRLNTNIEEKDYTDAYMAKLAQTDFTDIPFERNELIKRLPKILPKTNYHGDLTLENIMWTEGDGFHLIDCVDSEFDSYIFDLSKLRQDLRFGWFLRHNPANISSRLMRIQKGLLRRYPQAADDYILILMLLRVHRYTKPDTLERKFILDAINNLWR